jgi:hypothetical protein
LFHSKGAAGAQKRNNDCSVQKGTVGMRKGTTVVPFKKEQQAREKGK